MKGMLKKVIAVALSLCMLIPASAANVFAEVAVAGTSTQVFDNDGSTKITDTKYDKYFEGETTAAEGVEALLDAGKCYINGVKIPATEDESVEYQINWTKSLYETDTGWGYNVHKTTSANTLSFETARIEMFETTSTVRGHRTTLYLGESGYAEAINIESFEVTRIANIEEWGHDRVISRGDFALETNRVRYDVNDVHFPTENFNASYPEDIGKIAYYWYGSSEMGGTGAWHLDVADQITGVIESPSKGVYKVGEWQSNESNVSRYNLIDCSRPTQGYTAYTRLGLQDEDAEITLWNTPNGYPIGFTFGKDKDASRANLKAAIENAKEYLGSVSASVDGSDIASDELWATQSAIDTFSAAIDTANAVAVANASTQIELDSAMYALSKAWGDETGGFTAETGNGTMSGSSESGTEKDTYTEDKRYDDVNEPELKDGKLYIDNDGSTKITDAVYDKYFAAGTAKEGVEALLNEGKVSINGIAIPKNEDETEVYEINLTKSLYKTETGWGYNVHKTTSANTLSFDTARMEMTETTSTVRGHRTILTLNEQNICTAINLESYEVMKITYFEDHGGNVDKIDRGDFALETNRVRYDANKITGISSAEGNFDTSIEFGDVVTFWYGIDDDDAASCWHMTKAGKKVGIVENVSKGIYAIGDWSSYESNVSRYNLIDDSRPTQGYTAYTRLGLDKDGVDLIMWVTPNGYPIGFSYGSNAKKALSCAVKNAEELLSTVSASEDGTDVLKANLWATQEAIDTFKKAIDNAKSVSNKNSSASWDREAAIYALSKAWGDSTGGFVAEIASGSAEKIDDIPDEKKNIITTIEMPTKSAFRLRTKIENATWTSSDESIATVKADAGAGFVKTLRYGKVTISAVGSNGAIESWSLQTRYYDVNGSTVKGEDDYQPYYNAVYWAADNNITKGYDNVYFGPDKNCTRKEMAIFLWRMAGCPASDKALTFTDVTDAKDSTAYKAIAWAASEGIVKGYSDGSFGPSDPVTRLQSMIMLYRLAGKPAVSGTASFKDAAYAEGTDSANAIKWGVENGITYGYSDGTFRPQANCLRYAIVLFLYRYSQIEPALTAGAGEAKIVFNSAMFPVEGFDGSVESDPYIRIMLLNDTEAAAIVQCELVNVPSDVISSIKKMIKEKTGISEKNVWFHANHTITTPHAPSDETKRELYVNSVIKAAEEAINEAAADIQPVTMGIGRGQSYVNKNRNQLYPDGQYHIGSDGTAEESRGIISNKDMTIISFKGAEGIVGMIMSYGVKPTTIDNAEMSSNTRKISSDLTGLACLMMEEEFGAPCMFIAGAFGDQIAQRETNYFEKSQDGTYKSQFESVAKGIEYVKTYGTQMGKDAISIAEDINYKYKSAPITVAETAYTWKNSKEDADISVDVYALTMGEDVAFVGLKPEINAQTEKELWEASPYKYTITSSFVNGDQKYMPHASAYDAPKTVEGQKSGFAKGAAEEYVKTAENLLKGIKSGEVTRTEDTGDEESEFKEYKTVSVGGYDWYVLETEGTKQLLLSKYIIEKKAFNDTKVNTTWESSTLREYLNGTFYDTLPANVRAKIVKVTNKTEANPSYGIAGGADTEDNIFILSAKEAADYVVNSNAAIGEYKTSGAGWWSLRTMGPDNVQTCVKVDGTIDYHGDSDASGITNPNAGVRPAMWIDTSIKSASEMISKITVASVDSEKGSKVSAIFVEYKEELAIRSNEGLDASDFKVETVDTLTSNLQSGEVKIIKIYLNDKAEIDSSAVGTDRGNYIVIELNTDYERKTTPDKPLKVSICQQSELTNISGTQIVPDGEYVSNY